MRLSKFVFTLTCLLSVYVPLLAQVNIEQLRSKLAEADEDFNKVSLYLEYARKVSSSHPDVAMEFAESALALSQKRIYRDGVVQAYSFMGLLQVNKKDFAAAKGTLDKAIKLKKQLIAKKPTYKSSLAKDYRLLGHCEERLGDKKAALDNYMACVKYALEGKNRHEYAWGLFDAGQMQIAFANHRAAVGALTRSIEMANQLGLTNLATRADRLRTASMSALEKDMEKAQIEKEVKAVQEEFANIQDSLESQQETNQILVSEKELLELDRAAQEADLKAKEMELDQLAAENAMIEAEKRAQEAQAQAEQERWFLIGGGAGGVLLVIIISLFSRNVARKKHAKALEHEKQKSEELLFSILPAETAREIIAKGKATPRKYREVSILFTDFKGFTNIAANLTPERLLAELNYAFENFDRIIEKYGLEKIKTIGDAYMAAAGIPSPSKDHALDAVGAAMEMQAFMKQWQKHKMSKGERPWELRIGIHSGPVVAGVIGAKKFAYDIWGDAVNLASRMESASEPGEVNISEDTYYLVREYCRCEPRGKIYIKNKGEEEMYFVKQMLAQRNFQAVAPERPKKKSWWGR